MSATQKITTTTTTTREWKSKPKKKNTLAKAYSAQVNKASKKERRRCPTCGRPL